MKFLMLAFLVLGFASSASAYSVLTFATYTQGATYTLCNVETGTGVCEDANSIDYGATILGYKTLTYFHSGTGAYSCTIHVGSQAVTNAGSGDLSASGEIIGTISSTSSSFVYANANFGATWINCPTNPTNVTVRVQVLR